MVRVPRRTRGSGFGTVVALALLSLAACALSDGSPEKQARSSQAVGSEMAGITFQTVMGGEFLGAQNDGGSGVIAEATVAQAWETFTLFDTNGGTLQSGDSVFIQAGNGQYWQAVNAGGSTLNAASNNELQWETFKVVKQTGSGAIQSGDIVGLQDYGGTWVSAQNGGGGAVYAYGASLGAWEQLKIGGVPGGVAPSQPSPIPNVHFRTSLQNLYVGAQNNGGGAVTAVATVAQAWETFTLLDVNGDTLQSGDPVFIQAGNGEFFQALNGGGSTLNAASTSELQWETFSIVRQAGPGTVQSGDVVGLQDSGGTWVSAQNGGGGPVYAYGASLGAWEGFVFSTGDSGPSPPTGPGGAAGIAGVVSSALFDQMFPYRNPFYTYDGLVSTSSAYADFVNSSDPTIRAREAAAFLANVAWETGGLQFIDEIDQSGDYCDPSSCGGCPAGSGADFGRGPLQLSWNCNYAAAGGALGVDLLDNPNLVSTDASVSWKTAAWFWMTLTGANTMTAHDGITCTDSWCGFGQTIRTINGDLECDGKDPTPVNGRVGYYTHFCDLLGVSYGGNLSC